MSQADEARNEAARDPVTKMLLALDSCSALLGGAPCLVPLSEQNTDVRSGFWLSALLVDYLVHEIAERLIVHESLTVPSMTDRLSSQWMSRVG